VLPFGLAFDLPWLLVLLPLLLLLPRARVYPLRLAAHALMIVALAQPSLGRPSRGVAVLIDVSASVRDRALTAAQQLALAAQGDELTIFHFAGDTSEVAALQGPAASFIAVESTDLARGLQVAASSGAQRILLVSDGAESSGDALAAMPPLPIDVLPVTSLPNVRLVDLIAPQGASSGETVEVVAVVDSDIATRAVLYPTSAGVALEPIEVVLTAGRTSIPFRFQVGEGSAVRVSASLDVDAGQPTGDDALDIELAVSDEEPVLVLGDPAFADLLETQGFTVRRGEVSDVVAPLRYSAVVVREGASRFTPGQLDLLQSYVENGGGLMMTGGPDSFGFGAWYRTPVEEILPVSTDLRTEVALPLVALVIVMDRSQSMSTGTPSKIDLAKEGAISVVDLAYQDDLLGLVAFSDAASVEWVFELRPATDRGKQEMLARILDIGTQGGTVLEPAYDMAIRALAQTDAAVKHIIILSDGKLYDGQGPFGSGDQIEFNVMANAALNARITTSTIAIGQQADFERLEAIAASGGGRYYQALDVSTLPQIFTNEALTATRSLLREEGLVPITQRHPLLPSGLQPPALDAYIASTLKPTSEVLLEGLLDEPILAVSRQGLGRSAALTTDLNAWAGDFGTWSDLPGLLGTVTRWLQARPAQFSASVDAQGDELFVVVDAVRDGEYINNRNLTVRFSGGSAVLEQVAPGRYEGRIAAEGSGTLLVVDGDEVVARTRVTQPSPEFDTADGRLLLETLAARSGGQVIDASAPYAPLSANEAQPLWYAFAVASLALFLIELVVRRFGRSGAAPRRT
jgi:Mg-chelatase subunit ChlD